ALALLERAGEAGELLVALLDVHAHVLELLLELGDLLLPRLLGRLVLGLEAVVLFELRLPFLLPVTAAGREDGQGGDEEEGEEPGGETHGEQASVEGSAALAADEWTFRPPTVARSERLRKRIERGGCGSGCPDTEWSLRASFRRSGSAWRC